MEILDGRKRRSAQIKKKNRETIVKWFSDNPDSTITDCCKGLGFTYQTVKNHIDEINLGEKYHVST